MDDGTAPKPYTEEDVEKIAEAMYEADEGSTPDGWYRPWADTYKDTRKAYVFRARTSLDALAEAGRLRSDEVWIVGTDYADDEIFGVTATRAEAVRAAIGHDGDLPLHVVRYSVPYPSRSGGSDG